MLNPQELPIIEDIATLIYHKLKTRLAYEGENISECVPEYVALRLMNAIEWASPRVEYTKHIAGHLMDGTFAFPAKMSGIVRKYFDLPY